VSSLIGSRANYLILAVRSKFYLVASQYVDISTLHLSLTMTGQSLVKHILTEGDKFILSWWSPLEGQGGYAIAVNYGARLPDRGVAYVSTVSLCRLSCCANSFSASGGNMSCLLFTNFVPISREVDCTAYQAFTGSSLRDAAVTSFYPAVLFRPCHWICHSLSSDFPAFITPFPVPVNERS
jgi:hypothetical protein